MFPFFLIFMYVNIFNMKKFLMGIFKDDNDINEKAIIGFFSFLFLVALTVVEIVYHYKHGSSIVSEKILDLFSILVMSFFGIASVDKYINKKNKVEENSEDKDI